MRTFLVMAALILGCLFASAQTNTTSGVSEAAKALNVDQSHPLVSILVRGLEKAGGYVDKAVDFTMEQAPLVVKEYAMWIFVKSIIWGCLWLVPMAAFLWFAAMAWRGRKGVTEYGSKRDYSGYAFLTFILTAAAVVCIGFAGSQFTEAAKAKFAPRVLLIEKASELIRGKSEEPAHSSYGWCNRCRTHH